MPAMNEPLVGHGRCRLLDVLDPTLALIDALAVDAGEKLIAVGQYFHPREGVALVDLATRVVRWRNDWSYSTVDSVDSLAFSSDGERLWVALSGGALRGHDVADGRLLKQTRPLPGDSIDAVRLSRDARYAVVDATNDLNQTGWSGGVTRLESSSFLVAADAPLPSGDAEPLMRAVTRPGRNTLLRFRDAARIACSPDGAVELVSRIKGHEPAPIVEIRQGTTLVDTITFRRPGDFALAGTFSDDGTRFWVGTQSGLLFAWSLDRSASR
jgi:hypothetical protein